jgi:hypothetical protein
VFPDVCVKGGNGFVAGENCFVAGPPTKQSAENLNDFRQESQTEPGLGPEASQPSANSRESKVRRLRLSFTGPAALVHWLTIAIRSGDFLTFLWWRSSLGRLAIVNRSAAAADLSLSHATYLSSCALWCSFNKG